MVSIRLIGYDEILRRIDSLEKLQHFKRRLRLAAIYLQGKLRRYPGERHGPAIPPATEWGDRQRKGFFYHLRHGDIEIPYRRGQSPGSQNLQQRWTVASRNGGMTQVLANNAGYARLVQGPEKQTAYHKLTGWQTTEDVRDAETDTVLDMLATGLQEDVG